MAFTQRSQPARAAILEAARRRFTSDGYERTTIRSVAADARVDPAMVMRYYKSKEGLFAAAVAINLHLPDMTGVPQDRFAALLAEHFVKRWEGDLADEAVMILLRSGVTNPDAAQRLRTIFAGQVVKLVRAATNDAPDSELRAGMISTQILGIALTRYLLRLPPVVALDPQTLIEIITPVLQQFLTGPVGTHSTGEHHSSP